MLAKPALMQIAQADGELYNSLPLLTICFGMTLNVADPPRVHTNRMVVGRERV